MLKNGAVIFFSGTGNTKYVAKLFKERFNKENINIEIIDIQKTENLLWLIQIPVQRQPIPSLRA